MDKKFVELIGGILNEENRQVVITAFEQKLEEVREAAKAEVREEMSAQYAADKETLIAAMDRMLTDQISKELEEFAEDRRVVTRQRADLTKATNEARKMYQRKLSEHTQMLGKFIVENLNKEVREFSDDRRSVGSQRVKLAKAIAEAKREYKAKLAEHTKMLDQFMLKQLNEEMAEFAQDRRLLAEQRVEMARQVQEAKREYQGKLGERVKTLESFVLRQVTKEMEEFHQDKQALVESRVKILREGRDKIDETRKDFVKRAAKMVEGTIEEVLKKEMQQFRDDLKVARENNFGRRVFEAFYAEYMTSHLSEGSEVKKLQKVIAEQQQKLTEAQTVIAKNQKVLVESQSKLVQAQDKAKRTQEMNRLLAGLSRDKRAVMEEILENVHTERLEGVYNKYLPSVLSEDETTVVSKHRKNLSENTRPASRTVALTGNRSNRLSESMREQNVNDRDEEVGRILHLAGISSSTK